MLIMFENADLSEGLIQKAAAIKLLITDVDGVLTDAGVYYSDQGEVMKRFSIRDGMGVERLKFLFDVETGIITGETSGSVVKRAEKLKISHLHLGIKHKEPLLDSILEQTKLKPEEIAYIGDDVNDLAIMARCGLTASPSDGLYQVRQNVHYICKNPGGHGAFREFAELIIYAKNKQSNK